MWAVRTLVVDVPSVLFARHVPLQGASYTDLHMLVPAYRAMGVIGLAAGAFVLAGAWRGRFIRNGALVLGIAFVLKVLLVGIAPSTYQRLVVQPNELARGAAAARAGTSRRRAARGGSTAWSGASSTPTRRSRCR